VAGGVDFVIVTALEEEREAMLRKLPRRRKLPPSAADIHVYYSANLPVTFSNGTTGSYRVIVLSLPGMGRVQAATATSDAIHRWKPRFVLFVGIAGGVAAKAVNLGDVIIADQIVDYELQKQTPRGPDIRYEVYRVSPRLLSAARNLKITPWQKLITTRRPSRGTAKRHIGPIASGDKVVAYGKALTKYRSTWSKLIGVEMEAGGAAVASFQAANAPEFFMVRGVSDFADEAKGSTEVEQWRTYACEVAAAYTIGLLQSGPVLADAKKLVPRPAQGKPAPAQKTTVPLPAIFKQITQLEKDKFIVSSFETIKRYFRNALGQLKKTNPDIVTDYTPIDKRRFVSKIYVRGEIVNQCSVWIGGSSSADAIHYTEGRRLDTNRLDSYMDALTIQVDGNQLFLRGSGVWFSQQFQGVTKLTKETAAEYLWTRFSASLSQQRHGW
jgi:nucleoside phosphorylase